MHGLQMKNPKVSVCVVTYNQVDYIRHCLQSIVDQEADFDFEVIVGDDCSTDGTREIVLDFAEKYPDTVRVIPHVKNVGPARNYCITHSAATGTYVAHIDGDDYALPGKLQSQVDLLEANPFCSMVVHRMEVIEGVERIGVTRRCPDFIDLRWLLLHHPAFLNSSMMYRSSMRGALLRKADDFIDFFVYVHFARSGSIGFIDKLLGGYRASVGVSRSLRLMPLIQTAIDSAQFSVDQSVVRKARARQYRSYAIAFLLQGKINEAVSFMKNSHSCLPGALSWGMYLFASRAPQVAMLTIRFMKYLANCRTKMIARNI